MSKPDRGSPSLTIWYLSKYLAVPRGPEVGGRGFELMREAAKRGHRCVIVTSDSNHLAEVPKLRRSREIETRDGLTVCWLRTMKFTSTTSPRRVLSWLHFELGLLRLWKRLLAPPSHVVASSLSPLTFVTGAILARRYRAVFVVEVRDIWPLTLTEVARMSRWNPFVVILAQIEKFAYRRADLIIGTMPNLEEHVEALVGPGSRVACIPMGYSESIVAGNRVPRSRPHSSEPLNVFYAGTIGTDNALDALFEAIVALAHDSRFHFWILGDGELRPAYEARFAHLENLTFLGRVPKNEVQEVLDNADILYFSTHDNQVWRYGQSLNKLIDYMLAARPIIGSYGGYPSMVNEAESGTFVPPGDAASLVRELNRVAALDPSERATMGERSRSWVLTHRSYAKLTDDFLTLLKTAR